MSPESPRSSARPGLGKLMRAAWVLAAFVALGCGDGTGTGPDGGPADATSGFDDHTVATLPTREAYAALVRPGAGLQTVKFVITAFGEDRRDALFLDGNFYTLHDEWYWFRLLNGQHVRGDETTSPVRGFRFDSIALIYGWARAQASLPLDLTWASDERLYSPRFYQIALDQRPRHLGIGGILHVPATASAGEKWVFELEYSERVEHADIVRFFEVLTAELPPDVASQLRWVVRSPEQELLAQRMEAERLPFHDRLARYSELSTPGATEVYGEGIAAGRVRVVKAGEPLEGGSSSDILVLEYVPDYLPPCAGLVTSVPQTPLAHVAVLARNRGIPNVYLGGAVYDPEIDQLGRVNAPAILRGVAPGTVELVPITESEYRDYNMTLAKTPVAVEQVPLDRVELAYRLESLSASDADDWRPILGGKSTGFLSIIAARGVTRPEKPVGISIKAYVEHLAPMRPRLEAMLGHPTIQTDGRARYLVLEGEQDFRAHYRSAADTRWLTSFQALHGPGTLLGDLVAAGGVRGLIRGTPMDAGNLAAITAVLQTEFGDYAPTQGLRFRSSSNAEDIEGFNGAGLYDSNTGYLDPTALPDPTLHDRTVEWALKKTWASYWSFEGFEERRLELVDHLSGAMGVTVHARFDDELETSNGVMVTTVLPPRPLEGPLATRVEAIVMEVDAQHGAVSVTNPDTANPQRPEVSRVILDHGSRTPRIERVRRSTLSAPGQVVLDDAKLLSLFEQTREVTEGWLARERLRVRRRDQEQRTLTLDFEYREVAPGWPALRSGEMRPPRLVVKQARSLDPGLRVAPPGVRTLPLPKDVLVRARRITRTTCRSPALDVVVVDAFSDPLSSPDLGYSTLPFVASVTIVPHQDVLGMTAGSTVALTHLDFEARHPDGLVVDVTSTRAIDRLELGATGHYRIVEGAAEVTGDAVCTPQLLHATPEEFLFQLLATKGGR